MIFKKENLRLPREVSPCPIVEAICELRFDSPLPPDAVFGAAFVRLSPLVGAAEHLPLLGLPPEIRDGDPNLRFQPYYRFSKDGYTTQLGPRVFAVSATTPYPGWPAFFGKVIQLTKTLNETGVVGSVKRFGLRYINFFDGDVFDKIDLDLRVNGQAVAARETALSLVVDYRSSHIVRVRKDVTVVVAGRNLKGSVIDIDSFLDAPKGGMDAFPSFLEEAHVDEKTIFFGMLKSEFLATLNPKF